MFRAAKKFFYQVTYIFVNFVTAFIAYLLNTFLRS